MNNENTNRLSNDLNREIKLSLLSKTRLDEDNSILMNMLASTNGINLQNRHCAALLNEIILKKLESESDELSKSQ